MRLIASNELEKTPPAPHRTGISAPPPAVDPKQHGLPVPGEQAVTRCSGEHVCRCNGKCAHCTCAGKKKAGETRAVTGPGKEAGHEIEELISDAAFQIRFRHSAGNLHIRLHGVFNGLCAFRLLNTIRTQYRGSGRVFVGTDGLAAMRTHGVQLFKTLMTGAIMPLAFLFMKGETGSRSHRTVRASSSAKDSGRKNTDASPAMWPVILKEGGSFWKIFAAIHGVKQSKVRQHPEKQIQSD